ncbi:GSCFA domain-containing protein [Flavobacterium rivuli WB 3.3-2 = DSM 21788]|uniref:GSCFA domain-containing protein n=1 Tax=Flavobacterium rivuli WB 3.3-2 = DSM 21788 TaxID=1121895 RepID=A0A0A2M3B5_9FLAO|nr:GSCFA domain-containing protein [Flavobacterium rivuli]KGO87122.1 GSCFA domain-containing protein [Flavobacterium rivuli WB 3.3-2 = DSM 21788]
MQFSTQIPIPQGDIKIDHTSRVVSLGSCFAVNIGQKLDYFKFRNSTNPFGILFHPQALQKFIGFAVHQKQFTEADIFFHNERWHCFDAHSDLSHSDKEVLLTNLNAATTLAHAHLQSATHMLITLGTAWVYRNIQSNELVANCHKVPQKEFTKELLSANAIKESLQNIIAMVAGVNPAAQIIFTVSPVRHIKDGFTQNQWSKANLISALHEVLLTSPSGVGGLDYFPSYEIMMDELRDYRYYAEDMIHPSQTAIDYIWERFTQSWVSEGSEGVMKTVDSIQKGLQHRSFNPNSAQHTAFLSKLNDKILLLQKQYPHIAF